MAALAKRYSYLFKPKTTGARTFIFFISDNQVVILFVGENNDIAQPSRKSSVHCVALFSTLVLNHGTFSFLNAININQSATK